MKINVRIKPRSKRPKVEKTEDGYTVYVSEPPVENKANKALIEALTKDMNVFAPKRAGDNTVLYEAIRSFDEYCEKVLLTNTTAKDRIYLQSEGMYTYSKLKDNVELKADFRAKESVIFGCRPCDAGGFDVVDKLFNWSGYEDEYYTSKRKNTTIITVSCEKPESTCFCTSFKDGSPVSGKGSDLLLTPIKDEYLADVVTERGRKLTEKYASFFSKAGVSDASEKESFKKASEAKITKKLDLAAVKKNLDESFESPYWDEAHLACVKCGACTFVCPTCYCFDITEKRFDNLNGERVKTWDTCMSEMFTKMAGGHNPRTDTKRRFRQRFMHKFRYHVDNFKEELCTGCGRCIKACPVGIDVRKVIEEAK